MDYSSPIFNILFYPSIGMTVMALVQWFKPPKKINWYFGYRTPRSQYSQESWDFAQRYSAPRFLIAAIVMMSMGLLGAYLPRFARFHEFVFAFLSIAILILTPITMTEKAIRKKFGISNLLGKKAVKIFRSTLNKK